MGRKVLADEQVKQVANEIKRYLQKCPTASDSLHGITGWWLERQRIAENIRIVEKALQNLKDEGFIDERKNEHSSSVYFLKKEIEKQF